VHFSQGLAALSLDEAKTYLALPASQLRGFVAVHDITHAGQGSVLEIKAHHTPLAVMQWSGDSTMLATASLKGTIVRVFQMPQGDKVYSLR